MKFGKHIQKRQLDFPEYAASFVDYKALKKLIKKLSATPVIHAQNDPAQLDPQMSLQANKATFFFRLERELEKVNKLYLQKEAELKLRLSTLLEKKRSLQSQSIPVSRLSSNYVILEEAFRLFSNDLNKLQQFVEINATAFSKILKKWDKTSKSRTKELYISRAIEVQPCFNREVISDLSDQATTNLLDFAAWAEGEQMQYSTTVPPDALRALDADTDADPQIIQTISSGNVAGVQEWISRVAPLPDARNRLTRAFLATAYEAPEAALKVMLDTNLVDINQGDDVNARNCLHKAAISGRALVLAIGLEGNANVRTPDVYGRIPLHYACMHGHVGMIQDLVSAAPDTIDWKDHDGFTPLIHSIVHNNLACVRSLLEHNARIDPAGEADHIPLNLACQHGFEQVVELLLQARPQILPDAEGLYPQHLVARSGRNPHICLMLRDYGADLDQPDKLYQWTPLFHAASEGHVECLKTLLDCGVTVDVKDEKDLPAIYYATWEGHLECMKLLASVVKKSAMAPPPRPTPPMLGASVPPPSSTPQPMAMEVDGIPDLSLPPPIIPIRRYGHNFLENKTFVVLNFGALDSEPVRFYEDSKYPAARLTIASKSSDLIPRNILLPISEENKVISFQVDNLDTFSIDFDVFPTFGAKVIARTEASSTVFRNRASSSGFCNLGLFDPRLRTIGRIKFSFQIIKPFPGPPLEITHFATYWKATSQFDESPSAFITGSSLSGDYVRLFVQMTCDGVPVLCPQWKVRYGQLDLAVPRLTYEEFMHIGAGNGSDNPLVALANTPSGDMSAIHKILATSYVSLADALAALPVDVRIELHVLYPNRQEEASLRLGPTPNLNTFADNLLTVVFDHARGLRAEDETAVRSIVFSSFNKDICTALNWKQPNYPVLLDNELGADPSIAESDPHKVQSSGRTAISVKEAVQTAQGNNLMGLICSSRLLDLAPALIESIKSAGLVLIADLSTQVPRAHLNHDSSSSSNGGGGCGGGAGGGVWSAQHAGATGTLPERIDGFFKGNGVLRFNETVDI
ncbi:ankyrin repeat protein nuc-2 [Phyllosticta citriasiana]|uniref:ankyrin repeat protein nuc-2 n=1 Tax=Phyllosticta citriasiana TaxID=595635 RepID=UPI0030FD6A0E